MRLRIDNQALPGWTNERSMNLGNEIQRYDVFRPDGEYAGQIMYVSRARRGGGTEFGWVPERTPRAKLTNKTEAVRRMPRFAGAGAIR